MAPARRPGVHFPQGGGHNKDRALGVTLAEGVMTRFPEGSSPIPVLTRPVARVFPFLATVRDVVMMGTPAVRTSKARWNPGRFQVTSGGQGTDPRRFRDTRSTRKGGTGRRLAGGRP